MADAVNHPAHYAPIFEARQIECLDIAQHLDFCRGNAFKYVWRAGLKGEPEKAIEDCETAKFYITRVVETKNSVIAVAVFKAIRTPTEKTSIEYLKYNALWDVLVSGKFTAINAIDMLENAFRKELSK